MVSACLLPGARSRWRHGCRELMVDGGGDWGQGLLGKGKLDFGSGTWDGLGDVAVVLGGVG